MTTQPIKKIITLILIMALISTAGCIAQNAEQKEDNQTTDTLTHENETNCNGKDTCNIRTNKPFIIFEEPGTNLMITGGCFLEDIKYDQEYVKRIETRTEYTDKDKNYYTTYHRFMPIKEGTTTITTKGSCDYNRNITIEITTH